MTDNEPDISQRGNKYGRITVGGEAQTVIGNVYYTGRSQLNDGSIEHDSRQLEEQRIKGKSKRC